MPLALPVDGQVGVLGEQVDHGLGHGQRHPADRIGSSHSTGLRYVSNSSTITTAKVAYSKVESMPLKILIWSAALAAGPPT